MIRIQWQDGWRAVQWWCMIRREGLDEDCMGGWDLVGYQGGWEW